MPRYYDLPDLAVMDDQIANGTWSGEPGAARPLALFTAPRSDLSLLRLRHYTGTSARHFQNFVIFTNYQFYVDEFVRIAHGLMAKAGSRAEHAERARYTAFVEPGDVVTLSENGERAHNRTSRPPRARRRRARRRCRPGT